MNVACDYEAPMQMLTTEKYIAAGQARQPMSSMKHEQICLIIEFTVGLHCIT